MTFGGAFIWFCRRFKNEIGAFVDRLRSGKIAGLEFAAALDAQAEKVAEVSVAGHSITAPVALPPMTNTGTEVPPAPQSATQAVPPSTTLAPSAAPALPTVPPTDQDAALSAAQQAARIWQYNFLNLFLVRRTQVVLDWVAGRTAEGNPASFDLFDAIWHFVPREERQAIIRVLTGHALVATDDRNLMTLTPKGRAYVTFRGPLPPLPGPSSSAPTTSMMHPDYPTVW